MHHYACSNSNSALVTYLYSLNLRMLRKSWKSDIHATVCLHVLHHQLMMVDYYHVNLNKIYHNTLYLKSAISHCETALIKYKALIMSNVYSIFILSELKWSTVPSRESELVSLDLFRVLETLYPEFVYSIDLYFS